MTPEPDDGDTMRPDITRMEGSRKSLSLDNLQAIGDDDDEDIAVADSSVQLQSVMYVRNMNRSFRVAVDKSFDGPALSASIAGQFFGGSWRIFLISNNNNNTKFIKRHNAISRWQNSYW